MGVDFRGLDAGMAEELLHGVAVNVAHDKMAGEGYAQGVQRGMLDGAAADEFMEIVSQNVRVQRLAFLIGDIVAVPFGAYS